MSSVQDLMLNGFVIYPENDKFILKKLTVPHFSLALEAQSFNSYEEAVNFAQKLLLQHDNQILKEFTGIVQYNRGLGVEYKNLPNIHALNLEEAKNQAYKQAEIILQGSTIIEIRVRPK